MILFKGGTKCIDYAKLLVLLFFQSPMANNKLGNNTSTKLVKFAWSVNIASAQSFTLALHRIIIPNFSKTQSDCLIFGFIYKFKQNEHY